MGSASIGGDPTLGGVGTTNDPQQDAQSLDSLKQSKGFRQYDPGVFTNDDAFGQGYGYMADSGPLGYKQVKLSDLNIGGGPSTVTEPGGGLTTPSTSTQPTQAVPQAGSSDPTTTAGFTNPIRQTLLDRIGYDTSTPSLTDPTLGPQFSAFSTLNQQGLEQSRDALAERMAANGQLHSGAMDTASDELNQQAGLARATYGANLLGQAQTQRSNELDNLLGLGTQTSTADLNRNLSEELGLGDLALRDKLGTGQLDLGTLSTLLNAQNQNNLLGYYYANLGNNMNRDLILNGVLGS